MSHFSSSEEPDYEKGRYSENKYKYVKCHYMPMTITFKNKYKREEYHIVSVRYYDPREKFVYIPMNVRRFREEQYPRELVCRKCKDCKNCPFCPKCKSCDNLTDCRE